MNIAFYGSSLVSAYWNGAATCYRGVIRNLAELGHRVTLFEPDAYDRQKHRDLQEDPPWARVVVYPGEGEDGVHRVLDDARHYDVVVKASGVGVFDELLEREVLDRRAPGSSSSSGTSTLPPLSTACAGTRPIRSARSSRSTTWC